LTEGALRLAVKRSDVCWIEFSLWRRASNF